MTELLRRTSRRLLGIYCAQPEEVLSHAVKIALALSASLDRKVLFTIAHDPAMLRRAGILVVRYVVREATSGEELVREDFKSLVRSVEEIARAS